ncbi:MAG TPA: TIGR03618 family F420-dependent PPOX class oxidoreductase [Actinomycetota bacterium]|nr:TIGR03618 family F420-dependent PPOX class oxidoreductase [Actinomycetota bacterium]
MRTDLSVEDLDGFLDEPLVAVLGTLRKDGTVLLSPVWHEWRDGGFDVWVGADDVKARHIRRDPRASILVAESEPPLRGVEVRGAARILEGGAHETAVRIASRYIGPEKGAAYVGSDGNPVIIRLELGDLRVWDFADENDEMGS